MRFAAGLRGGKWRLLGLGVAVFCAAALVWLVNRGDPAQVIVLVSIDTLRADALSSYGNPRSISPHLDGLAADGVRFTQAVAPSPWTIPSHASLLTSLHPSVLQATADGGLPRSVITLAELLREAGYATGAIVNTAFLTRKFGFDQGFDDFREPVLHKGAPQVVDAALSFLQAHAGEPAFLFLHLFDVHGPYEAAPSSDSRSSPEGALPTADVQYLRRIHYHDYLKLGRFRSLAELRAGYEAGVHRVDVELGRFFAELRQRGVYDDALIVVTADHGEAFFEHGTWVGHGLFLYDSELRIPMIVKLPKERGWRGKVVDVPVSLIDVMPTVLEVVGHAPAPSAQGQSLLSIVSAPPADRNVFGHSSNTGYTEFVRSRRWKFIGPLRVRPGQVVRMHLRPDADVAAEVSRRIVTGPQLFDLSTDPGEATNLAADHPDVVETMTQILLEQRQRDALHRRRHVAEGTQGAVDLTDSERERLRSLGYAD